MEVGKLYRAKKLYYWMRLDRPELKLGVTVVGGDLVMVIAESREVDYIPLSTTHGRMMHILLLYGEQICQFWYREKDPRRFAQIFERAGNKS